MMKNNQKITPYLEIGLLLLLLGLTFRLSSSFGLMQELKPINGGEKTIMFIGIFFMGFIVLGVHELGHLLTGLAQGFRFQLYVVGPLGIKREDGKIKVYFNTNLGYYGGVAATSPTDNSPDNAKKFGRILLAGPIASLLFAAFCIFLAWLVGKPLGMTLYIGGIMSIAIFYVTTIPSRTGPFFTDRKRYQRLTTPGKDQRVELAILNIMGTYSLEESYKNVDKKDIEELITDEIPFMKIYGLYNLICYQVEVDQKVDPAIEEKYATVAKSMSKSLITGLNKELEKHKKKHGFSSDQVTES